MSFLMETTDSKMSETSAAESNRQEVDALWVTAPQVSMMGKSACLESDCVSLQEEENLLLFAKQLTYRNKNFSTL